MKQVLLSLGSGRIELAEIPSPVPRHGQVVIRTRASLVSAGTERMLVEFGRSGLIGKARSQPEKVRKVLDKVLKDGLLPALDGVRSKLGQPLPLGYCNAGVVTAVGAGVTDMHVGDRVVSNGPHAELVAVARTMCAPIPKRLDGSELPFVEAAFTVLGAVALEGLRLAVPTLGERFVVTGLGLVGLLAAQLLRASGCSVLGLDVSESRLELARKFGIETYHVGPDADPVAFAMEWTHGLGVDGVFVAASTDSSQPIGDAAAMSRRRGRVIQLGVTGLDLERAPFYEKELTLQVACSYGPGRYDPNYEEKGHDYPAGYVRWTAGRNFGAVLEQIAAGRLDVASLITHRIPFMDAVRAWDLVTAPDALGIVLEHPDDRPDISHRTIALAAPRPNRDRPGLAVIGAGNYATAVLLPALRDLEITPVVICAPGGISAAVSARIFDAARATSDVDAAIEADDVDAVLILTRHDSHADLVCKALAAGKHVFVEKPLCTTRADLVRIRDAADASGRIVSVGFNRRWAPQVEQTLKLLRDTSGPRTVLVTVNAGAIPRSHWIQDATAGAGRIVGEACHFVDLARVLCESAIASVRATQLGGHDDTVSISLGHENGSVSTILYVSTGHQRFPKERIEVFAGGRIIAIDNYRRLHAHGWSLGAGAISFRQDKGHREMMRVFVDAVRAGGPSPIPFDVISEVMTATFDAAGVAD